VAAIHDTIGIDYARIRAWTAISAVGL